MNASIHKKIVRDAAEALGVTEEIVFIRAIRSHKGFDSTHFGDAAANAYNHFHITGTIPQQAYYVQDYCLNILAQQRRTTRLRAEHTRQLQIPGVDIPVDCSSQSLISELRGGEDGE